MLRKGTSFAFFGTRRRAPRELWARNMPESNAMKDERDKEEGYIEAVWKGSELRTYTLPSRCTRTSQRGKRWSSTSREHTFVDSLATFTAEGNLSLQDLNFEPLRKRNVGHSESNRLLSKMHQANVHVFSDAVVCGNARERTPRCNYWRQQQNVPSTDDSPGTECTPETYFHRIIVRCMLNGLAVCDKPHRSDEPDIQNATIIGDFSGQDIGSSSVQVQSVLGSSRSGKRKIRQETGTTKTLQLVEVYSSSGHPVILTTPNFEQGGLEA